MLAVRIIMMGLYVKVNWEDISKVLGIVITFMNSKAVQNSKVRTRERVVCLKIRSFFNSDSSLHVLTDQRRCFLY